MVQIRKRLPLLFQKLKNSFILASRGQEKLNIVLWGWGLGMLLICYFIIQPIIKISPPLIDSIISGILIAYFVWHIVAIRKCAPKAPKLTKEEKKKIKAEKRKVFWKSFGRKLMLKEPFTKWRPAVIVTVADLYAILVYVTYLY